MKQPESRSRVILLDNRDSFVHTVARYLRELGAETRVVRSDAVTPAGCLADAPTHLVVSPGPCTPREAGVSTEVIQLAASSIPILGICLGHQCVAAAFGAEVGPASVPAHGRAAWIHHRGGGILNGIPSPFRAARYHSLSVLRRDLPAVLAVEAETEDGEIMALRHETLPVWGVQFHPESVLTPDGRSILARFLALRGPDPPAGEMEGGK